MPITLRKANDFVDLHHRHSGRTARNGGKFAISCVYEGALIGVAIVGNPLSATYMDGFTAEVLRVCVVPGAKTGACSFLYARCWQAWRAMGGTRMVTYTLQTESGVSLKAAGWRIVAEVAPHKAWHRKQKMDGLPRLDQEIYAQPKLRWEVAS